MRFAARTERLVALAPFLAWALYVLVSKSLTSAAMDDDFATFWEVKNYLATGQYVQHQFTAPLTYPLTLMGAGTWKLLPFLDVETALRVATLAFSLLGMYALRDLARQAELSPKAASLLAVAMMASYMYSYTSSLFYSDIPFLGSALLAIALYTRGMHHQSWRLLLGGSLFCSLAVLFRQTGVALVVAVLLYLVLQGRRTLAVAAVPALCLPVLCTAYVVLAQSQAATFAAVLHEQAQSAYLRHWPELAGNAVWRLLLVPIVVALFTSPLIFLYAWHVARQLSPSSSPGGSNRTASMFRVVAAGVLAMAPALLNALSGHSLRLPYLPWYFDFSIFSALDRFGLYSAAVALLAMLCWFQVLDGFRRGAQAATGAADRRSSLRRDLLAIWRRTPLLLLFATFSLGLLLILFKAGDKYYLFLLPPALLLIGKQLDPVMEKWYPACLAGLLVVIAGNAVLVRNVVVRLESEMQMVDAMVGQGIERDQIHHSRTAYEGFQRYVAEVGLQPPNLQSGIYFDFFHRWAPQQSRRAPYSVQVLNESELKKVPGVLAVREVKFLGVFTRYVVGSKRPGA